MPINFVSLRLKSKNIMKLVYRKIVAGVLLQPVVLLMAISLMACIKKPAGEKPSVVNFCKGADVSWLPQM